MLYLDSSAPRLQSLEWDVPGSDHGTAFFAPGADEVDLLRQLEPPAAGTLTPGEGE